MYSLWVFISFLMFDLEFVRLCSRGRLLNVVFVFSKYNLHRDVTFVHRQSFPTWSHFPLVVNCKAWVHFLLHLIKNEELFVDKIYEFNSHTMTEKSMFETSSKLKKNVYFRFEVKRLWNHLNFQKWMVSWNWTILFENQKRAVFSK